MKQIGLVVNLRKVRGGRFLDILVEWFEQRGVKVVIPQSTELMYIPPFGCPEIDFQEEVDLIISNRTPIRIINSRNSNAKAITVIFPRKISDM
jgi:hypothetical protein